MSTPNSPPSSTGAEPALTPERGTVAVFSHITTHKQLGNCTKVDPTIFHKLNVSSREDLLVQTLSKLAMHAHRRVANSKTKFSMFTEKYTLMTNSGAMRQPSALRSNTCLMDFGRCPVRDTRKQNCHLTQHQEFGSHWCVARDQQK